MNHQSKHYDRIVVGGGAMGLATAWQIAKRGSSVLLIEQFAEGHTEGASHGATRNLNNAYAEAHYLDLYDESLALYRELERDTGAQLITLCGLVTHGDEARVRAAHEALQGRGITTELISPGQAAERWPGMRFEQLVMVNPQAGRINAEATLRALAEEALRHGAALKWATRVTNIDVVERDRGAHTVSVDTVSVDTLNADGDVERFTAAGVVVTAGAWSAKLLGSLPGIAERLPELCVTEEHPAHFTPEWWISAEQQAAWPSFNHFAPTVGGRAGHEPIYGMFTPGEGVKVGYHLVGAEVDPDERPHEVSTQAREALRAYVTEWVPGVDPDTAEWVSCTYTSTPSERFVLDRFGAVTVGAGFSGQGFKFVPAVGRVLAEASLTGVQPDPAWRVSSHASPNLEG